MAMNRSDIPPAAGVQVKAEPAAWRYTSQDISGDEWPWTYTENRAVAERQPIVEPLYAAPPAAGVQAVPAHKLPSWWKPSPGLRKALENYRAVKADFDEFDGDRRGIGAALGEREFGIMRALADDHLLEDDGDHNTFVVSPMVKFLVAMLDAAPASPVGEER